MLSSAAILLFCLAFLGGWALLRWRRQNRHLQAELAHDRQRLQEAQRLAHLGSWELDLVSGHLSWSDELYRIFQVDPSDQIGSYEIFLQRVHPEDRAAVDQAYRSSVEQRLPYRIEHRLLLPDGTLKQVLETGETFYDADGKPLRSIGTAQDVTETRLMESRMALMASAFEHSGEAIVISDADNRIVMVNPSFTRLTGYSQADVLGKNPSLLSAGRTTAAEYERMWQAIHERGFWQGEVWDRRKDGGIYPKWLSVSVIYDEAGAIRYHLGHFTDISAERAAEARLHHMAHHDVLTGLCNRFSLQDRLDQAMAQARREKAKLALMFIDLDRFKVINDTLGHHIGDELLIEVSQRLRQSVRDSDVVARLGGDEFVIMLAGIGQTGVLATLAEKLVANIGEPYQLSGHTLYTTPSIGIAIFPDDGVTVEALMKNADAAMYHAKTEGRNNFQFFDSKMNDQALERLRIEQSLRQGLAKHEFVLHYQPILDVASGEVRAVEALVRWQHPERGLLAPGAFIGVAEETGLIQPLGDWVFWTACSQLAAFHAAGLEGLKMSINISAIQMRNGNLPILARGAIDAFGLQPAQLIFEITETVAMQNPTETARLLQELRAMGVTLALDDFGTGYSSLSYLRLFALDHLKLDRSFVEEIGVSEDGQVICDATIGLARNLRLNVIAEGVETEAQLAYLKARGCEKVQGYLFCRPLPAEQVMAYIRERNARSTGEQ